MEEANEGTRKLESFEPRFVPHCSTGSSGGKQGSAMNSLLSS